MSFLCSIIQTFRKVQQTFLISWELADNKETGDYHHWLTTCYFLSLHRRKDIEAGGKRKLFFSFLFSNKHVDTVRLIHDNSFRAKCDFPASSSSSSSPSPESQCLCATHSVQIRSLNVLCSTSPPPSAPSNVVKTTGSQPQTCSGGKSLCVVIHLKNKSMKSLCRMRLDAVQATENSQIVLL